MITTYLENSDEIFDDNPIIIIQFILPQLQCFVRSDLINSTPVFEYENHHIVGGVPSRYHIAWDKPHFEAEFRADSMPGGQNDCCRMNNRERKLSYL